MTSAEKNIREINTFLNQHADGFVLIGFNPTDGEPMVAASAPDAKTACALNALMGGILSQGGVGSVLQAIKQKKEGNDDERCGPALP